MRIAVFCGSSRRTHPEHLAVARALGAEIARRGHTVVYGGCRTGSMGALADAALGAGGRVIGVILQRFIDEDFHHRGLDELVSVSALDERKTGLTDRGEAFVVLPGGLGTLEELIDVLSLRKIHGHAKPMVLLDGDDFFAGLRAQLERGIADRFDREKVRDYFSIAADPADALRILEEALAGDAPAPPRP